MTTQDGFSNCAHTDYKSEVVLEVSHHAFQTNDGLKSTGRTVTTPTATSDAQAQSISQKLFWKFHSTLCFHSLDLDPEKASCCERSKAFIFFKEDALISLSPTPLCETLFSVFACLVVVCLATPKLI